ncbi:MAG: hypothetical protein RL745_266 [Actinomycetota bacterium]|jgi:NADH-quinone oxidoreductase subunit B
MIALRLHIVPLGLACCALEYQAAVVSSQFEHAWAQISGGNSATSVAGTEGSSDGNSVESVDVLVLAGTMTHALTATIKAAYAALGNRRAVVSFGACSISGGPYWDSYSVVNVSPVPVDLTIPGCPPTPQALIDGLQHLQDLLSARPDSAQTASAAGVA